MVMSPGGADITAPNDVPFLEETQVQSPMAFLSAPLEKSPRAWRTQINEHIIPAQFLFTRWMRFTRNDMTASLSSQSMNGDTPPDGVHGVSPGLASAFEKSEKRLITTVVRN